MNQYLGPQFLHPRDVMDRYLQLLHPRDVMNKYPRDVTGNNSFTP